MVRRSDMCFPPLEHEVLHGPRVMVPLTAHSVGPQASWGGSKRVLSQTHHRGQTGSALLHKHCVHPKTSNCPALGSPCPPGPAGLAAAEGTKETQTAAHLRSYSNGQGFILLFVFRSPTDEARWLTAQIFTCGNRLF